MYIAPMKKPISQILLLAVLATATACFEIREEIAMQPTGSGTYKVVLDLSAHSKELKMVLAAAGQQEQNPFGAIGNPFDEVDSLFAASARELNALAGITNAREIRDQARFEFGMEFGFSDVNALNTALSRMQGGAGEYTIYYTFAKSTLFKENKFTLGKLVEGLKPGQANTGSEELNTHFQSLYNDLVYKFVFMAAAKVGKSANAQAVLSSDKKTLTHQIMMKDLAAGGVDVGNQIKFK